MAHFLTHSLRRSSLAALVATALMAPVATADVYDFSMMTGGATGTLAWAGKHVLVEVTQGPTSPASTVLFKFTNAIPVPAGDPQTSNIVGIWFDTGTQTDLFTGMSVAAMTSGVSMIMNTNYVHVFFERFKPAITPNYTVTRTPNYNTNWGVSPGESLTIAATLAPGKSLSDVLDALDQGITSATAASGLRVVALVQHILGSASYDDAAFVTNAVISEVAPPPPPPPGTCP